MAVSGRHSLCVPRCSATPRISLGGPRTVICACLQYTTDACTTGYSTGGAAVGTRGGCSGWVLGGVVYRVLPPTDYPRYLRPLGTPGPCRAFRTPSSSHSPYPAPGLSLRTQPQDPASGPGLSLRTSLRTNKARFRTIYLKVSHKSGVSTKKRDEAWHSPCFKNMVQMSRP